jgi:CheY-like chemotaxis protein
MTIQNANRLLRKEADTNRKVILCVDDEVSALWVRKMILESQGYRVLTAEDGRAAAVLFSSEAVDLVVLDYMMPGMHGGLVAEHMRHCRPKIPIVMLSADLHIPSETLALIDRFIVKGEQPAVLFDVIQDLLNTDERSIVKSGE